MTDEKQPVGASVPKEADPLHQTDLAHTTPAPVHSRVFEESAKRPLYLPWGLRMVAAWTLCIVVIAGGLVLGTRALKPIMAVVVIPVGIAILLNAMLKPVHKWLSNIIGNFGAAITTVIGFVALIGGLLTLVGTEVASQLGELSTQARAGYEKFLTWLESRPFGIDPGNLPELLDQGVSQLLESLRTNSGTIISGVGSAAQTAGSFLVGSVLAMFLLIFFLADGERIARWVVNLLPGIARPRTWGASVRAWETLGSYVRVQILVAAIDAIGIAIGAAILGVPLYLPIGVLVFLGSFVPIVGALATGIVAVLVALVTKGGTAALILILVVILVQQIESNVLQPILMGRAVSLHPVAVVLAVSVGSTLLGIFGAVIAVPIAAMVNRVGVYLSGAEEKEEAETPDPMAFAQRLSESSGAQQLRKLSVTLRHGKADPPAATGSTAAPAPEAPTGNDEDDSAADAESR